MRNTFRVNDDMRSHDTLTAARAYINQGFKVLLLHGITNGTCDCGRSRCKSQGKHPIASEFPNGMKSATTDRVKIQGALKRFPNANLAIVPEGNLVVIDVDGQTGRNSISRYHLPITASVRTGRGHHLYLCCEDVSALKHPKLDGVDFRLKGNGYIVAPPSRHISEKRYSWNKDESTAAVLSETFFKNSRTLTIDFSVTKNCIHQGGRNNMLTSLGGTLLARGLSQAAIEAALLAINAEDCVPPLQNTEVKTIAQSLQRYALPHGDFFGDMSDVVPEKVRWLYRPYLPRGCLTVLDGEPGIGKSNFCIAVVAALTRGTPLSWSQNIKKGSVLILSAEDDPARVLKPRLIANKADLSHGKVRFCQKLFSLDTKGIELLRAEISRKPPLLVVIDPIVAFMGHGSDTNDQAGVTFFLSEIDAIAREFDCSIVIVRHFRKSNDGNALNQGMGSIAWAARVRSMLVLAKHPTNPDQRAVAHAKSSYDAIGPTVLFSLANVAGTSRVRWEGVDADLSANELVASSQQVGAGRPPRESNEAAAFLISFLSEGERDSKGLFSAAKARSIPAITLRRTLKTLGIRHRRVGKASFWRLPSADEPGSRDD